MQPVAMYCDSTHIRHQNIFPSRNFETNNHSELGSALIVNNIIPDCCFSWWFTLVCNPFEIVTRQTNPRKSLISSDLNIPSFFFETSGLVAATVYILVGGWTNPFQKYARQIGWFPQGLGWKKIELPPPRLVVFLDSFNPQPKTAGSFIIPLFLVTCRWVRLTSNPWKEGSILSTLYQWSFNRLTLQVHLQRGQHRHLCSECSDVHNSHENGHHWIYQCHNMSNNTEKHLNFKNFKVMKVLQNQKNISWQLILNFLQFLQLDLKV